MSSSDNHLFEPPRPVSTDRPVSGAAPESSLNASDPSAQPSAQPTTPAVAVAPPPVEDPVWSGWDVLGIALLAFVATVALQFALALTAQFLWYPRQDLASILSNNPVVLLASQCLLYLALAACMMLLVEGKYGVAFWHAVRWNWRAAGWRALGLGVALFLGLILLQNFLPMPKDTPFEHLFSRPRDAYLISVMAVTVGPLMEELFFRGLMYPVLARRMGVFWGVALTAVPFGLIHLPQYGWAWGAGLVIFLVGVACGIVRAATKSVAASFLVHVGYNGTQMVIAFVATQGFRHLEKAMLCLP